MVSHVQGKKGKRSHKFLIKFQDGSESLLPYEEVKNLEALDKYLSDHPEVRISLKL